MNIDEINGIECNCGRTHQIPIDEIIIGEKVLNKLDNILRKYTNESKFYLIVDKNTKKVAGNKIKKILLNNEWNVEEILLEEKKGKDHVEPDTDALFKILASVDSNGYLLACGSGTINDLTAFAADKMDLPYSIITTAPSMDGYASSVSSITVNGVKQTYNITPPQLIIADLELLSEAPWKMIQSGLGDLLGKISSLLEWKLGRVLFDEYFCSKAFLLIKDTLDDLIENSDEIKNRKENGIRILTVGLINSGIAMMMVESSRPASGTEHHISHFFDMYSEIYQKPVPPHGIKVGIALNISTYFYLKLLNSNFDDFSFDHDKLKRKKNIKRIYLDKSSIIINLLDKRWEHELLTKAELLNKEEKIKDNIIDFEKYLNNVSFILKEFNFFKREDVQNLNFNWLNKAINYSFELRFRYTISTLLNQLGLLDNWGNEAINNLKNVIKQRG